MTLTPFETAGRALANGQVIAYPTETVFGLGVDPHNPAALERLAQLKGRAPEKGFILLIGDPAQLTALTRPHSATTLKLMDHFWPGPLTLVLPALPGLHPLLTGGTGSIAVRRSPSPVVAQLLNVWGGPLVSSSANRGGEPVCAGADEVRVRFGDEVATVLEGEASVDGTPSTVLGVTGDEGILFRAGAVDGAAIRAVCPDLNLRRPG